ncbi:Predicted arabinose efflux permease, MFS family [Salinibacillus kushneri]|uniref:Predicted arabinose efflux permease, MFS family n=1 Tax=Salinibacillus kushneri TaxID=237682 RepID=A0A1I0F4E0_9BACI|nr:MFS transporter [Salinibacillus kushneri]SET52274.1 Predicted arabinose efflux permease, MFS family [Salinibacillus kushneri]
MTKQSRLIFRNKIFFRLWMAQSGSSLGDWFNHVALAATTLSLTQSPTAMGLVLLCRDLPQVTLSFLAGPLLDRFSKRLMMYISDLVRALVAIVFIWAALEQQMWAFYTGSVLMGIASSVFGPARNATIPGVVAEKDITEANSWTVATSGVLSVVGAAFGGLVSTVVQPAIAFAVNAFSYIWSAAWILITKWKEVTREQDKEESSSYFAELREGFTLLKENRIIMALICTSVAFAIMSGPYFVMIPVLGDLIYNLGGIGIGLLYVADGLAFILSASLVGRVVGNNVTSAHRWYGWGFVIQAAFFVAFAFSTNVWAGMIFIFLSQLGAGILLTLGMTILQMTVSPEVRGRIFAIDHTVDTGVKQLSLLISGPAISLLGSPIVGMIVGVIGGFAGISWWYVSNRERKNVSQTSEPYQI